MAGRILTAVLTFVGIALYYAGAGPLVRWLGRKNPKVLLYHDCAEAELPYLADLDCTTSPTKFAEHLDYLQRYHKVVPLETIVEGAAPPGSVAITFDDGYRSVYENAFPILRDRSYPATFYLIADVVGNDDMVWVNELNFALRAEPAVAREVIGQHFEIPEDAMPHDIISYCRMNYSTAKMQALLLELRVKTGQPVEKHAREARLYVDWDEVAEMEANGMTFGNHTLTHPNMERLTEEEQRHEIFGAHAKLALKLRQVHSFAHPFGHRGSKAAEIAKESGSRCSVEVGGANTTIEPLRIGRVHLSNQSIPEVFARMEVVEPIKEFLRRRGKSHERAVTSVSAY